MDFKSTIFIFGTALIFIRPLVSGTQVAGKSMENANLPKNYSLKIARIISIGNTTNRFLFSTLEYSRCKTIGGPSKNKHCVFPFKFNGEIYNRCAFGSDGFWCATKVDSRGLFLAENLGICGSDCPKGKYDLNTIFEQLIKLV